MVKQIYWFWENKISKSLCDVLLSQIDDSKKIKGTVSNDNLNLVVNSSYRDVDLFFEDWTNPIGSILFSHGFYANKMAEWNFSIVGPEDTQITYYSADQYHDWHSDWYFFSEYTRKITTILFLSDVDDYDGGELCLTPGKKQKETCLKPSKGSIISFPSYLEHKVNPVISGERITAVNWIIGPAFI